MLIRTYRVRGHLAADLDPLGLAKREMPADLTPEYPRLHRRRRSTGRSISAARSASRQATRARDRRDAAPQLLRQGRPRIYAHQRPRGAPLPPGADGRARGRDPLHPRGQAGRSSTKVVQAEQWEKFLARKYVGTKRFGLDGGESMVPALEAVIKYGGQYGVAHDRHRHGPSRPPQRARQRDGQALPRDLLRIRRRRRQSRGCRRLGRRQISSRHLVRPRVRRDQGPSRRWSPIPAISRRSIRSCSARPAPQQVARGDVEGDSVLPVLLHGDAAFAGQGIVAECFGFSGIPGYTTGGCLHFVINNQVGFTTSPAVRAAPRLTRRTSPRRVQAPILHVNGDDPEAVTFACKLAIEYRQTFNRDIVIDMWCYRRFGHNEGDEPSFTQPLMYAEIRQHPPISELYAARLVARGGDRARAGSTARSPTSPPCSKASSRRPNPICPTRPTGSRAPGPGLGKPQTAITERRNVATGVDEAMVREIGRILTTVPDDVAVHKTLLPDHRRPPRDVRERRGLRLGDRRGARLRHPAARGPSGPPVGPGQRPRHVQPAPLGLGRPERRAPNISR